jgi:hypothetical protein
MAHGPGGEKRARVPTEADLRRIAARLNDLGARYAVIGGFAMIHHGFARATMDLDLLVDARPENVERIRQGLSILEDQAVLELAPDELEKYAVVRVADEIVVDLLSSACGVTYDDLRDEIEWAELGGIDVPYASPAALLRTKQTVRDKDVLDRLFLEKLLAEE